MGQWSKLEQFILYFSHFLGTTKCFLKIYGELFFRQCESELIEKICKHHLHAATSASFQAEWIDMCFYSNISSSPCPWQSLGSHKPVVGQAALSKLVYIAVHLN